MTQYNLFLREKDGTPSDELQVNEYLDDLRIRYRNDIVIAGAQVWSKLGTDPGISIALFDSLLFEKLREWAIAQGYAIMESDTNPK